MCTVALCPLTVAGGPSAATPRGGFCAQDRSRAGEQAQPSPVTGGGDAGLGQLGRVGGTYCGEKDQPQAPGNPAAEPDGLRARALLARAGRPPRGERDAGHIQTLGTVAGDWLDDS